MPQLQTLLKQSKFKKKEYRPWDLSGVNSEKNVNKVVEEHSPLTDISSITNREQIDNNQITLRQHLDNKQPPIGYQEDIIKITSRYHSDNKLDNNSDNKLDNNSDNKDYLLHLKNLTGTQEKIFNFVLNICCMFNQLETGPISTFDLASAAECSYGTAKIGINRLIKKYLLLRKNGKASKGGFINLGVSNEVKIAALQLKEDQNARQLAKLSMDNKTSFSGNNLDNRLDNDSDNNSDNNSDNKAALSSSSINTTTTGEFLIKFNNVNIEPLRKYGLSDSHIKQLEKVENLTDKIIQDSIDHFAFDLEKNNKMKEIRTNPMNYFMGILRREGIYNAPANYESPREKALKQYQKNKKQEEERLKELFGKDYKQYRNQKIKEIYNSFSEDLKTELSEFFQKYQRGVGVVLFREAGLSNEIALEDFSDFVMSYRADSFKDVPSFTNFCNMQLEK
jgi:hypothetical protein